MERNATVQVSDDLGNTFDFQEAEAGRYESITEFAALHNVGYKLSVITANGKSYESETVITPTNIPIDEVNALIGFNEFDKEGLEISLTNQMTNSDSKYFRYQYEETYKIVAPFHNAQEFDIIDSVYFGPGDFDTIEIALKPHKEEARVCFNTLASTDIVLSDTQRNSNNQTGRKTIRFLESDDFKISHRYSILVKQYGLTQEAHGYFTNLDDFTSSESVFSEIQPGFLEGNIKAINSDESVLGYFEVAALSERRYFFNYANFFPDRPLPPYAVNCILTGAPQLIRFAPHLGPDLIADSGVLDSPLLEGIQSGLIGFYEENEDYRAPTNVDLEAEVEIGPFYIKAKQCVDCRVLGSNIKPDFWIE